MQRTGWEQYIVGVGKKLFHNLDASSVSNTLQYPTPKWHVLVILHIHQNVVDLAPKSQNWGTTVELIVPVHIRRKWLVLCISTETIEIRTWDQACVLCQLLTIKGLYYIGGP